MASLLQLLLLVIATACPILRLTNTEDLALGLGFAHAQDRRTGTGRLAEVLGQGGVEADRLFRTFNFAAKAQTASQNLLQDAKDVLLAYAEGVNAHLAQHNGVLPIEFITTNTMATHAFTRLA